MHRRVIALITLLAGLLVLAFAGPAAASDDDDGARTFTTTLTGAEEVGGGDPDGAGFAAIRIRGNSVCWLLQAAGTSNPVAAHIHFAPAGQNGGVVVPLSPPVSGSSFGCTQVDRDLARAIKRNPTAYYVNVHTGDFPGGALRGQLDTRKSSRTANVAQLVGAEEVAPADPDGVGWVVVTFPERGMICWEYAVTGIDPATAAHIHRAPRGVAGGVVVATMPPAGGAASWTACATVDADLAREIRRHPARFYSNVHNMPFPAGAIRGQLMKARHIL